MAHQQDARGRGEGEAAPLSGRGETIAAIATPPGRGGIGIVRLSGPRALAIAREVTGDDLHPRRAHHAQFRARDGGVIDEGIALFFAAPASYTGEDVVELQGHGGPMVMRRLLRRAIEAGARLARPGEFTERAFLNERLDLAQAEGVADLIEAASEEAARSAVRSLTGEFSARVHEIVDALTALRTHVEACIDFPEEEIDPADARVRAAHLARIRADLDHLLDRARQGALLRDGLTVVLLGRPNVGKSSLLNRLAGEEVAIVTPIPGTTRDYVKASVEVDGIPVHLVDTAGLREAGDEVERLGVERSWRAVDTAGAVLFVSDSVQGSEEDATLLRRLPAAVPVLRVLNKIDLLGLEAGDVSDAQAPQVRLSARTGAGIERLRNWLLRVAGWQPQGEGVFLARERHLDALRLACAHLEAAVPERRIEIQAEELRLAQLALGRITGEVSADEILGRIFASFCIGK